MTSSGTVRRLSAEIGIIFLSALLMTSQLPTSSETAYVTRKFTVENIAAETGCRLSEQIS